VNKSFLLLNTYNG
jgi:tRNA dimethylallyltransferase